MRYDKIKTEPRIYRQDDLAYNVESFGINNDYPQKTIELLGASGTATLCANKYAKFINGQGIADMAFYKRKINGRGLTVDQLLRFITNEWSIHNGFSVHFNYNIFGRKTEVYLVPFENGRIGKKDDRFITDHIALHQDWGRRDMNRYFNSMRIDRISVYNPIYEVIQAEIEKAGGVEKYKGQVLYFSNLSGFGVPVYPKSKIDPIVTDVATEPATSTVLYRNANNNFLPNGMMVTIGKGEGSQDQNNKNAESDNFDNADFVKYQGAEKACKIIHLGVEREEEIPKFIEFPSVDFDKRFTVTNETIKANIGNIYEVPPVLRGQVNINKLQASATEYADAYQYMNNITKPERILFEEIMAEVFRNFEGITVTPDMLTIQPLTYV